MDHESIMARVKAISPRLAENAGACEQARRVVPVSFTTMLEAGMFRISQPSRTGGYELSLRTLAQAVTALSENCPSSGWVLMVIGAVHWCMGHFSEAAQDEVLGNGNDLVAGTLALQGTATEASGGYRVSGRWQFGSGIDLARWVMLGCADSATRGLKVHAIAPIDDVEVDDTWHVMGLSGTGSKDVVAGDIFVPAHRAVDSRAFFTGRSPHVLKHKTNLYRLSMDSVLSLAVATAVLGSARSMLCRYIERIRERKMIGTGASRAEHSPAQVRFAEAAAEIRCAALFIDDQLTEFERLARIGNGMTRADRAIAKWQAAYAAELCRRAVTRLFFGSGAHAAYLSSPMQTAFRNVCVAAQHGSIDFDTSAEDYGRAQLVPAGSASAPPQS